MNNVQDVSIAYEELQRQFMQLQTENAALQNNTMAICAIYQHSLQDAQLLREKLEEISQEYGARIKSLNKSLKVRDKEILLLKAQLETSESQKQDILTQDEFKVKSFEERIESLEEKNNDLESYISILETGVNLISPPSKYTELHGKIQREMKLAIESGFICNIDLNRVSSVLPENIKLCSRVLEARLRIVTLKMLSRTIDQNTSNSISKESLKNLEIDEFIKKGADLAKWCKRNSQALDRISRVSLQSFNISVLPKEVYELASLQQLDLKFNSFNHFPKEIIELTQLENLDLKWNSITEIPSEIGILTNLTVLHLDDNPIKNLPPALFTLTALKSLSFGHYAHQGKDSYRFTTPIPTEIGLLTQLEQLSCSGNYVPSLPTEIGNLTRLKSFHAADNLLTYLPTQIGCLTNLTQLGLTTNRLTSLPIEIGQATKLTEFYLQWNQISNLPTTMTRLSNLRYLVIDKNVGNSLVAITLGNQGTEVNKI